MPDRIYRVALLGCGKRGTAASRGYQLHPRTQMVALCDLDAERLNTLGDDLGVAARHDNLSRMLEAEQPDLVIVPTQTDLHFPLCMEILDAGPFHLDVEKPMTVDLEQADQLLARARERGVQIAVHHQASSLTSLRAAKASIEAGRIGVPLHLTSNGKGYYGGYELMNMGTHMINAILETTGPVRSVMASATTDGRPIEAADVLSSPSGMGTIAGEKISATFEFANGLTGTLHQHMFTRIVREALGFEIVGTEGRVKWHYDGAWLQTTPHALPDANEWQPLLGEPAPPILAEQEIVGEGEYWYVDDYVKALDSGGEHRSSGIDGRHIIEIIMAIFESGAYRRPVSLPQEQRDHPLVRFRAEAGLGPTPDLPRPYREWLAVQATNHGWSPARTGL
jgi:predicted dehydrogenase